MKETWDAGLIPGSGRSSGGGHGNPFQYSCLKNIHGQRSQVGYNPWGHKESIVSEHSTMRYYSIVQNCAIILQFTKSKRLNLYNSPQGSTLWMYYHVTFTVPLWVHLLLLFLSSVILIPQWPSYPSLSTLGLLPPQVLCTGCVFCLDKYFPRCLHKLLLRLHMVYFSC